MANENENLSPAAQDLREGLKRHFAEWQSVLDECLSSSHYFLNLEPLNKKWVESQDFPEYTVDRIRGWITIVCNGEEEIVYPADGETYSLCPNSIRIPVKDIDSSNRAAIKAHLEKFGWAGYIDSSQGNGGYGDMNLYGCCPIHKEKADLDYNMLEVR